MKSNIYDTYCFNIYTNDENEQEKLSYILVSIKVNKTHLITIDQVIFILNRFQKRRFLLLLVYKTDRRLILT